MIKPNEEAVLAAKLMNLEMQHTHRAPIGGDTCSSCGRSVVSLYNATQVALHAAKLKSMARGVHRLDEVACGRELTEYEHTRHRKLFRLIREIAAQYGITRVDHNGDPRGYAVYLHFPDGRGNSWGGDGRGWGI